MARSAPMATPVRPAVVVVPVKPPEQGKSRLAALGGDLRRDLARAIALDTVAATVGCGAVADVLVTTDDAAFAAECHRLGALVMPDGTAGDLNATLVQAAHEGARRHPDAALVALCADLPSLRSDDVEAVLIAAADASLSARTAYVPDAEATGTTLYLAHHLEEFRPRFGAGSAAAHADAGAVAVGLDLPRLRADVDSPAQIAAALALGVGPRTAAVLGAHAGGGQG